MFDFITPENFKFIMFILLGVGLWFAVKVALAAYRDVLFNDDERD